MNIGKKITQVFLTIFLLFALASCDTGCVNADEFDTESVTILANPTNDNITGSYGAQVADWHDTGLKSNGDDFLIYVSGSWLAWNNDTSAKPVPCDFCARGNGATNCICYAKSFTRFNPQPETDKSGNTQSVDCSLAENQNDPDKCTCTQQFGAATDYGNYHFPLNYYNKDETVKNADEESLCTFTQGVGAYISLWGKDGATVPNRVYHLFSEEPICDINTTGEAGTCVDKNGDDVMKYVFRSANSRIFMKDDNSGNTGVDPNTSDDIYHEPRERVKVIIYDDNYSDNSGQYNVTFLRGVGESGDVANAGLLEYLVRTVENVLLGKTTYQTVSDGDTTTVETIREGGIIEGMYKSIAQDSGFVLVVQMAMGFYVAFFGAAHLMGVVELASTKELLSRMMKIVLLIFFISPSSWYFYDQIVVGFFKDSMDYVVAFIMNLSDKNISPTSSIIIAQMDRATDVSSATRFSYVDLMIKKLISESSAKKIFGLFFGAPFFGMLYIPIIYGLIAYFIYVMLFAASLYLISVMKIIFVLALGPIFMCFSLFKQTEGMFKKWVAYLGGRSFEIIVVFLVLYNFLNLLDIYFTDLLYFKACPYSWGIPYMKINVIKSSVDDRNLVEWFTSFLTIGGLIFITQLVLGKVGSLSDSMFSVMGTKPEGGSAASSAGNLMASGLNLAQSGLAKALDVGSAVGSGAIKAGTAAFRKLGLADALNRNTDFLPNGPRTWMRNLMIDGAIKQAQKEASGKSPQEIESNIRASVLNKLQLKAEKDSGKMALAGIDTKTTLARLDEKLVKEPLKNFLKEEAKKMKGGEASKIQFGKDAEDHLRKAADKWAESTLLGGRGAIKKYLDSNSIKSLMKEEAELRPDEAAKKFGSDKDLQNKYLKHLKDNKLIRDQETEKSWLDNWGTKISYGIGSFTGSEAINRPEAAQEKFAAKLVGQGAINKAQEEYGKLGGGGLGGALKRVGSKTFGAARRMAGRNISAFGYGGEVALEKDKAKRDIKRETTLNYLTSSPLEDSKKAFLMHQLRDYSLSDFNKRYYRGDLVSYTSPITPNLVGKAREAEAKRLADEARKLKNQVFDQANGAFTNKNDTRTLYEKAADLSHIYHQFGIKGEDPMAKLAGAMKAHAQSEEARIREGLEKRTMSQKDAEEALKALGSTRQGLFTTEMSPKLEEALKEIIDEGKKSSIQLTPAKEAAPDSTDALIKAQDETNKSLAELSEFMKKRKAEEERVFKEAWDELRTIGIAGLDVDEICKKSTEQTNEASQLLDKKINEADPTTVNVEEFKKEASQIEQNSTVKAAFVATGLDVEFGATISDILLKTPNVGLEAGNPFLGVSNADPAEANEAHKNLLKFSQMQLEARIKIATLNKKIKEFELQQLKNAPADQQDHKAIAALEGEVRDIEREITAQQNSLTNVSDQISNIERSS